MKTNLLRRLMIGNVYIFSPQFVYVIIGYFSCHLQYKIRVINYTLYFWSSVETLSGKRGRFKTTKYGLFNISGWIVFIIIEILCKNWLSRDLRQIITQTVRQKASDILLFCEDNADNFPVWIYVIRYLVIYGKVLLFFKHLIKFLLFCHYPMRKKNPDLNTESKVNIPYFWFAV